LLRHSLFLLLLPCLALADADPRFEKLRAGSEPLGGLGPFLERYVGKCEDLESRAECQTAAKAFRQKAAGKRLYMMVVEDAAIMMDPGAYKPGTGEFTILVTPIFGANNYALTLGGNPKADAAGNPVMPRLVVNGTTTEGWNGSRFQRLFSQRELRLQLVFTPEDTWTLNTRGGKVQGVRGKLLGLLVTHGRTGETLATYFPR
jgi:hypothetical protein